MKIPPDVRLHNELRLFTWHPSGVLDSHIVSKIIEFIEYHEKDSKERFNRFTDLSGLTAVKLDFETVFRVSLHRRQAYAGQEPVKSAFLATSPEVAQFVKLHELLTDHSPLHVSVFSKLDDASDWLGVSPEVLLP